LVKVRNKCTLMVTLLLLLGPGCRIGYLFHVAGGQFKVMAGAIPVEEALKERSLLPDVKDRLQLVARIKTFGEEELGLKATENYQTVYLKSRRNPLYVVSASPKDRLERMTWWFPIVGDMPYLGFFDLEEARAEKERLLQKDLDVTLAKADAYSTLGWFKDPITLNLIEGSTPDLVETILHEMTHTTLYVKGQGEFNEGLAVLVGSVGAALFLERTYGPSDPLAVKARASIEDERLFASFLASLLERLERLYHSPATYQEKVSEREKIFSLTLEEFTQIKGKLTTDRHRNFGSMGMNNAYLMSLALYHRHYPLFERTMKAKGNTVRGLLDFLNGLVSQGGNLVERMQAQVAGLAKGPDF
jgi:predicted aminopeptidase